MFYLGSISGSSGAAYNWSGGVSGFANFSIPKQTKAFFLEASASGTRFLMSAATGYTAFLSTGGVVAGANLQAAGVVYGPYARAAGTDISIGVYHASATQYSVRIFGAHTPS